MDGDCTNQAESFFSRVRRSVIGMHGTASYSIAFASFGSIFEPV